MFFVLDQFVDDLFRVVTHLVSVETTVANAIEDDANEEGGEEDNEEASASRHILNEEEIAAFVLIEVIHIAGAIHRLTFIVFERQHARSDRPRLCADDVVVDLRHRYNLVFSLRNAELFFRDGVRLCLEVSECRDLR